VVEDGCSCPPAVATGTGADAVEPGDTPAAPEGGCGCGCRHSGGLSREEKDKRLDVLAQGLAILRE
jgi:hypothetical protein